MTARLGPSHLARTPAHPARSLPPTAELADAQRRPNPKPRPFILQASPFRRIVGPGRRTARGPAVPPARSCLGADARPPSGSGRQRRRGAPGTGRPPPREPALQGALAARRPDRPRRSSRGGAGRGGRFREAARAPGNRRPIPAGRRARLTAARGARRAPANRRRRSRPRGLPLAEGGGRKAGGSRSVRLCAVVGGGDGCPSARPLVRSPRRLSVRPSGLAASARALLGFRPWRALRRGRRWTTCGARTSATTS